MVSIICKCIFGNEIYGFCYGIACERVLLSNGWQTEYYRSLGQFMVEKWFLTLNNGQNLLIWVHIEEYFDRTFQNYAFNSELDGFDFDLVLFDSSTLSFIQHSSNLSILSLNLRATKKLELSKLLEYPQCSAL